MLTCDSVYSSSRRDSYFLWWEWTDMSEKLMEVDTFQVCVEKWEIGAGSALCRGGCEAWASLPEVPAWHVGPGAPHFWCWAIFLPPLHSHLTGLSTKLVPGFWTTLFSYWPRKTFWGALGVCISYSEASWGDVIYWVDSLHSNLLKPEKIRT